jgi:hypothetical protein
MMKYRNKQSYPTQKTALPVRSLKSAFPFSILNHH